MGGFHGADVAELRTLARTVDEGGRSLRDTAAQLDGEIGRSRWIGPDGEDFTGAWRSTHRTALTRAAGHLQEAARALLANADAQEVTSTDILGGPGGGGPGGLPESSDRPGDPGEGNGPDMGEHEPIDGPIDLSDEALDPTNMEQGALGDCWFLAAAGAVAQEDPDWIREHLTENEDGTWTVTFYDMWGNPVEITVEPTLAENGTKGAGGEDSWISIYEKAAAEYFGGNYSDIEGDLASRGLLAITGNPSQLTYDASLEELREQLENGPVVATTEQGPADWYSPERIDDTTIVPNHAYVVESVEERVNPATGETETMVHLLNPWGPDGGELDGEHRAGDLWLTEEEYRQNFQFSYSTELD
jgi:hypothetical protein